MAHLIPLLQKAIEARLSADSDLQGVGVYRSPVGATAEIPYVSFMLLSPGEDDRAVCGGVALQHPVFEVVSWFRDGDIPAEDAGIAVAGRLVALLSGWAGTVGSIAFSAVKIADVEIPPRPNDAAPLVRGYGVHIRFDI